MYNPHQNPYMSRSLSQQHVILYHMVQHDEMGIFHAAATSQTEILNRNWHGVTQWGNSFSVKDG